MTKIFQGRYIVLIMYVYIYDLKSSKVAQAILCLTCTVSTLPLPTPLRLVVFIAWTVTHTYWSFILFFTLPSMISYPLFLFDKSSPQQMMPAVTQAPQQALTTSLEQQQPQQLPQSLVAGKRPANNSSHPPSSSQGQHLEWSEEGHSCQLQK